MRAIPSGHSCQYDPCDSRHRKESGRESLIVSGIVFECLSRVSLTHRATEPSHIRLSLISPDSQRNLPSQLSSSRSFCNFRIV